MSFEAKEIAEERKKAKEIVAFSDAREKIESKAREFSAEAEGQLSELRKRAIDGFKDI